MQGEVTERQHLEARAKAAAEEEARTRLRASLGQRGGFRNSREGYNSGAAESVHGRLQKLREGAQDRLATLRDQGGAALNSAQNWMPDLGRVQLPLGSTTAPLTTPPRSERAKRAEQQRL